MESEGIKFIKLFDYHIASELSDSGFSFMIETVNDQQVFVFELTEALLTKMRDLTGNKQFGEFCYVEDRSLTF